jgi:uncharacterized protein (TIGR00725 family)
MRVSVIGGSTVGADTYETAVALGRLLAERGHTVVCGGYGGVMEAVCRGAREQDGETIGILRGADPTEGNDHLTHPIATGMGEARNAMVVLNGRACVAVDGAAGTLTELGFAFVHGRPVAGIDTHDCSAFDGFRAVDGPAAAVEYVERVVD